MNRPIRFVVTYPVFLALLLSLAAPPLYAQNADPRANQAKALRDRGEAAAQAGNRQAALEDFLQALPLARAVPKIDATDSGVFVRALLVRIAREYDALGQWDKAMTAARQALAAARQAHDPDEEAGAFYQIAETSNGLEQRQQAVDYWQQAATIARTRKLWTTVGWAMLNIARDYQGPLKRPDLAAFFFKQTITYALLAEDRSSYDEASRALPNGSQSPFPTTRAQAAQDAAGWRDQGQAAQNATNFPKARDCFQKALAGFRQARDRAGEGDILLHLGEVYRGLGQNARALTCFQQSLVIKKELGDRSSQRWVVANLGMHFATVGQPAKAIYYFQQALSLFQEFKDREGQLWMLTEMAGAFYRTSRQAEAWACNARAAIVYEQEQGECHAHKDAVGEAQALMSEAIAWQNAGRQAERTKCLQEMLTLSKEYGDTSVEEDILDKIGTVYYGKAEFVRARDFYQQAYALSKDTRPAATAKDLMDIARVDSQIGRLGEALKYCQQALSLFHGLGNREGEAKALGNLGAVYGQLGQPQKSLECLRQCLAWSDAVGAEPDAIVLLNSAAEYEALRQYDKALESYSRARAHWQRTGDLHGVALTLEGAGSVYAALGQLRKGLNYERQVLDIFRRLGAVQGVGRLLVEIGALYQALGLPRQAQASYQQSLSSARLTGDRMIEAAALENLMDFWQSESKLRLAIFYGKQAINDHQSVRSDLISLNQHEQNTFLSTIKDSYRLLAELLIRQGRLPEAQQVLGMLKEDEFFDFVRREPPAGNPAERQVTLSPVEADWQRRYALIADRVTAIGKHKEELLARKQQAAQGQIKLASQENKHIDDDLKSADADLTVANKAFQAFLTRLETEFSAPTQGKSKAQFVQDAAAFSDTLQELGPGTVALYTIVEPDKYRVIVVTSQTQKAEEYPIKAEELRKKVLTFRQALQDPHLDPRPAAHDLYTVLFCGGRLARDLDGAHATTLMWSLDDVLRYVPMAALYDSRQYLVEKYRTDVFTPASNSRLTEAPAVGWSALGLGVSKPQPGFNALPGVAAELEGVIHDPVLSASASGALPGTIEMDGQFTQAAMTSALEAGKYPLVHIASHFAFQPGDETASFLLLGDGSHLTLAQIKTLPRVFQGVDLLTLSACDTASGDTAANGQEVEGFGVLAQRQGAKAVLASLWPVSDASTPLLMRRFYQQREATSGVSKAAALQAAQLFLLRGSSSASPDAPERSTKAVTSSAEHPELPAFPSGQPQYAHPFFWAPFVLIGNWK